jgi:hypothetical protein
MDEAADWSWFLLCGQQERLLGLAGSVVIYISIGKAIIKTPGMTLFFR